MRNWSPGFFWVGLALILAGAALTGAQIALAVQDPVAVLAKAALIVLGVAFLWQSARNGRRPK